MKDLTTFIKENINEVFRINKDTKLDRTSDVINDIMYCIVEGYDINENDIKYYDKVKDALSHLINRYYTLPKHDIYLYIEKDNKHLSDKLKLDNITNIKAKVLDSFDFEKIKDNSFKKQYALGNKLEDLEYPDWIFIHAGAMIFIRYKKLPMILISQK